MERVAIAGMGFMGKTHLGVYRKLPAVAVAALFDVRAEALELTSLEMGGKTRTSGGAVDLSGGRRFTDYDEMFRTGGAAEIRSAREGRESSL